MLSPHYYDNLNPRHRETLVSIEKHVFSLLENRNIDNIELEKSVAALYNKFMMPKEFWDKIIEYLPTLAELRYHSVMLKIFIQASSHQFYYERNEFPQRKIYKFDPTRLQYGSNYKMEDYFFPHKNMDNAFAKYEKDIACSFAPKCIYETIERMKVLYSKIKAAEKNDKEWFKVLLEVEDEKFIEDNIEYRIGRDLTNKMLWKMYIQYLKENNNQQKLLQTYSKYCRFFLDDSEMLEEYRNTVGEQKVSVPWRNPVEFEVFDETFFDEKKKKISKTFATEKTPLMHRFNPENALNQRFPFRPNLMYYIITNAYDNAKILHQFYKSCKMFYLKNPVTISYKFEVHDDVANVSTNQLSVKVNPNFLLQINFGKLYISTSLFFCYIHSNELSLFIHRIYKCTAKYIIIKDQKLSEKELEILFGSGNVEELTFWEITNSNNSCFSLENLLKMLPKIKFLHVYGIQCTPETSQIICEMPFKNKIEKFEIWHILNTILEPKAFAEFVKKHFSSECDVSYFDYFNFNHDHGKEYKEIVDSILQGQWKIEHCGSRFSIASK